LIPKTNSISKKFVILTPNHTTGNRRPNQADLLGDTPQPIRLMLFALLIFTPLARGAIQGWAITVIHLITWAALTLFFLQLIQNPKWMTTPLDMPLALLVVLTACSMAFSVHRPTSTRAFVLMMNYVAVFYLVRHTVSSRTRLLQLVHLIIGIAVFLSVFGLIKKFGANPFVWWDYPDIGQGNLASTYGNRNHLAGYLEMTIPLVLGLFLVGPKPGKTAFLVYLLALLLTTLVLTLSRGGWVGTISGLIFMSAALLGNRFFLYKRYLGTLVGGLLFLSLVVFSSTSVVDRILTLTENAPDISMDGRVTAWKGCLDMIETYPLLGTGPGTFGLAFTRFQPAGFNIRYDYAHNDYLQAVCDVGLFLIPVAGWILTALFRRGFSKLKNPSRLVRGTTLGALSGIVAILVHSFVDFNLQIPANALLFTVLAAIVVSPPPEKDRGANQ